MINPLLHFIWLSTPTSKSIPFSVMQNLKQWALTLQAQDDFKQVLWVDKECFDAIKGSCLQTNAPDNFFNRFGLNCTCYLKPFGNPDIRVPILFIEQLNTLLIDANIENIIRTLLNVIDIEKSHRYGLVQVASDILRLLILFFWGGGYIDCDVKPSEMRFIKPNDELFNKPIILCKWIIRGFLDFDQPENDIIFANNRWNDIRGDLLFILEELCKFYDNNPYARINLIASNVDNAIQSGRIAVIEYQDELSSKPLTEELDMLRKLRARGLRKGHFATENYYKEQMNSNPSAYLSALNFSISAAGFANFAFIIDENYPEGKNLWKQKLKKYFSQEPYKEQYYSWKTPGLSTLSQYEAACKTFKRFYLKKRTRTKGRYDPLLTSNSLDNTNSITSKCSICRTDLIRLISLKTCFRCKRVVCSECLVQNSAFTIEDKNGRFKKTTELICKKCYKLLPPTTP